LTLEEFNEMAKGYLVRREVKAVELAHIINARFRKHPVRDITEITGQAVREEISEEKKKKILDDWKKLKKKFGG